MDPCQRLILEVGYDTCVRSGMRKRELMNASGGVYVGISQMEYAPVCAVEWESVGAYYALSNSHSAAAGRISFTFDLKGPALSIDTACSSSLVAFHSALLAGIAAALRPRLTACWRPSFSRSGRGAAKSVHGSFGCKKCGIILGCRILGMQNARESFAESSFL